MDNQDDEIEVIFLEERDICESIAHKMMEAAELIDALVIDADEDTDLSVLINKRDWLRDCSTIFLPPGEPHGGYPKEGAKVFNIESERARRRR